MSSLTFETLQSRAETIAWSLNHDGLKAAVTKEEANDLLDTAIGLQGSLPTHVYQELLLRVSLICDASLAAEQPAAWLGIANLGTDAKGRAWFEPTTPEAAHLYAWLLINNAIARYMCGEGMADCVEEIAHVAIDFLERVGVGAENGPPPDRWVAALCVVLARIVKDPEEARGWAAWARTILQGNPSSATPELHAQIAVLTGEGSGAQLKRSLLDVKFWKRPQLATFVPDDLFNFRC